MSETARTGKLELELHAGRMMQALNRNGVPSFTKAW